MTAISAALMICLRCAQRYRAASVAVGLEHYCICGGNLRHGRVEQLQELLSSSVPLADLVDEIKALK